MKRKKRIYKITYGNPKLKGALSTEVVVAYSIGNLLKMFQDNINKTHVVKIEEMFDMENFIDLTEEG